MMLVPVRVEPSKVHGQGLFAAISVPVGAVLWRFMEPDHRKPLDLVNEQEKHFGYINPGNPDWLVICGDVARYWNFGRGGEANCRPDYSRLEGGEAVIVASREIGEGEELLISTDSDGDACRKMGATWLVSDKV